ncbi:MAG TPA: hypothetical protein VHU84_16160 [Lacipirellulaceae bacterium]|jgi:hypothetical protein|nr:hypothetical protein [Lacipirellulaceae bacterium]
MRSPWSHFAGFACLAAWLLCPQPTHAQLWRNFLPTSGGSKSAAAQGNQSSPVRQASAEAADTAQSGAVGGDFPLTQDRGPWLIVAASFAGDGAEKQAGDLASELRTKFRMAAYVCEMNFKFGDDNPGQGLDNYGAPTRRRYRRGDQAREIAVLVGDFQNIEDADAQQMLSRIKTLEPQALKVDPNQTTQTMAQVRQLEDSLMEKVGKPRKRGPMCQAFFTRNPMLPREYFVPKGVDPFVAKMNEGVEHSLLDCPGRQTIKVATFRGKTILQTNAQDDPSSKSIWGHKKDDDNPLIEAAENAHLLTKELRDHGWEAYEFHNRTESIVTIGSFAETTQKQPDGRLVVIPQVQKIVQTFDAGFDTPADPLTGIGNDAMTRQRVAQEEQQVNQQLGSKQAQVVPGMNPKHVKIMHGRGKSLHVDRIIPMDIHPEAIDVPKRSISSAYAG